MTNNLDEDDNDIDLIEKYHRGLLDGAELEAFLEKEKGDNGFAQKVKAYTDLIGGIEYYGKQKEFADTTQEWEKDIKEHSKKKKPETFTLSSSDTEKGTIPINRNSVFWLGAAAACILLFVVFLTFFQTKSPEQLANAYIDNNLTTLSTTMRGETDSLASGIGAFNVRDYEKAEVIFNSLQKNEDLAPETTKYLGIIYLKTGQYDKAIGQFNKLISFTDLYANPGKFYLAVTLMKRSKEGDTEDVKNLLHEVVTKKLPGYKEASDWMEHL